MYIRGLIPRNFAELAEAVPIVRSIYAHAVKGYWFYNLYAFFSCINKNGFFNKETDTFGHIVV